VATSVPPPANHLQLPASWPIQPCADSPLEKVRIRIALFYDGTGNNRINVDLGRKKDPGWFMDNESYANGYSNIALLERIGYDRQSADADFQKFIYTSGIGTVSHEDDVVRGLALGTGSTGIEAKVDTGIAEAIGEIAGYAAGREIIHLHVDTFGFSRGAAAARLCLWKCLDEPGKTLRDRLKAQKLKVGTIQARFVGLYDTVASLGLPSDHGGNTEELHLRAISRAKMVVQLAAADEHRKNFRLTNIKSAGGKGRQYFLPGAHSDVGGGYAPVEHEDGNVLCRVPVPATDEFGSSPVMLKLAESAREVVARERKALVDAGWYTREELEAGLYELAGTRGPIPDDYRRIPLKLMAEYAAEDDLHFSGTLALDHGVPKELQQCEKAIRADIAAGRCAQQTDWTAPNPPAGREWLKAVRHRYLHFSSFYKRPINANEPQWSGDDPFDGRRQRIIQDG
jgi:hypothetical protein